MLYYDFERIYRLRGVSKSISHLYSLGISRWKARQIYNDKIDTLSVKDLTILCKFLNCTPNDLLNYHAEDANEDHVLCSLIKDEVKVDYLRVLREVDIDRLERGEGIVD